MPSVLAVLFVFLVVLVIAPVIVIAIAAALVTIPGPGSDGRATGTTDTGTDQLARAATDALADGSPAQGTDGAAERSFVLVAPIGRGRTTSRPPQGGPHQGAGVATQLLADHGARHPAGSAAENGIEGLGCLHLSCAQQQRPSSASALMPNGFIFMGYSCQT